MKWTIRGGRFMLTLKKGLSRSLIYVIEIFVIVISIFPILWVIMSAFKTNGRY